MQPSSSSAASIAALHANASAQRELAKAGAHCVASKTLMRKIQTLAITSVLPAILSMQACSSSAPQDAQSLTERFTAQMSASQLARLRVGIHSSQAAQDAKTSGALFAYDPTAASSAQRAEPPIAMGTRLRAARAGARIGSERFPHPAALGASYVPDLARRSARARAAALYARGYSWLLGLSQSAHAQFSSDRRDAKAFALATARGVDEADTGYVVDGRQAAPNANTIDPIASALLRDGAAGFAAPDAFRSQILSARLGFAPVVLQLHARDTRGLSTGFDLVFVPPRLLTGELHLPDADLRVFELAAPALRKPGSQRSALSSAQLAKNKALARELAQRSLVVLRDPQYVLPLHKGQRLRVLGASRTFLATLRQAGLELTQHEQGLPIIVSTAGSLPQDSRNLLKQAGAVLIALDAASGLATDIPPEAAVLLCMDHGRVYEEAIASALSGRSSIDGRLPFPIEKLAEHGAGLTIGARMAEFHEAQARDEGFRTTLAVRIDKLVTDAIEQRVFPACQIVVGRRNAIVFDQAFGTESYADDAPRVTREHLFDLASVTKIAASTAVAMALEARGKLELDQPVHELVPSFTGKQKDQVTLRMLLTHSAGLAGWKRLWLLADSPDKVFAALVAQPLIFKPGSSYAYSDLGMILFGRCLESFGGARLDKLATQLIYEPLKMHRTRFGPLPPGLAVVPTEDEPGRGGVIQGRVHDENAESLGGVAGHAGLFSNARDLARLARCIAAGGSFGGQQLFPRALVDEYCRRRSDVLETSRALGFDTPTSSNSAGRRLSKSSVGHTGFTGTSLWIDRQRDLFVVCLTNRIHPSRNEPRIHAFRRRLHDLIIDSLAVDPAAQLRAH